VEVTGQNTHWDGSTIFHLRAGIQVTKDPGEQFPRPLRLDHYFRPLASEGPTWVTTTAGEIANLNNGFVVRPERAADLLLAGFRSLSKAPPSSRF